MLSAHGVQVLQLSFVKVTHSLSVLSLPASAPGWESLLSMICPQHDSLDSMVANYIVTHRMHPHTPLIWYNWQGLGYCYIIHLLSCCRVLTITFQSGEPPPSALRYALPCLALPWTAPSTLQQLQQHHVAMFAERCDQWNVDFEAVSATAAGASGSSRTSAEPTKQMLAQQRVWRTSQLAALSAASLTGYISYTSVVFIYLFF